MIKLLFGTLLKQTVTTAFYKLHLPIVFSKFHTIATDLFVIEVEHTNSLYIFFSTNQKQITKKLTLNDPSSHL